MLNFMKIEAREATLNCHEVLTPNSLSLTYNTNNFAQITKL